MTCTIDVYAEGNMGHENVAKVVQEHETLDFNHLHPKQKTRLKVHMTCFKQNKQGNKPWKQ